MTVPMASTEARTAPPGSYAVWVSATYWPAPAGPAVTVLVSSLPCPSKVTSVRTFVVKSLVPAPVQAAGFAGGVDPAPVQLAIVVTT